MTKIPPNNIKNLRQSKGITQTELAKAMGVSSTWLSQCEKGKVPLTQNVITKLTRLLNCSVDDLFNVNPFV